jgi:export-related chaperone CsaA
MTVKPDITWADFEKIDIRCGTIISVNDFEKARNPSYQLEIDFGDLGIRKSSAQITSLYQKEELVGKQILAVVNFPKSRLPTSSVNVLFWDYMVKTKKMSLFWLLHYLQRTECR